MTDIEKLKKWVAESRCIEWGGHQVDVDPETGLPFFLTTVGKWRSFSCRVYPVQS